MIWNIKLIKLKMFNSYQQQKNAQTQYKWSTILKLKHYNHLNVNDDADDDYTHYWAACCMLCRVHSLSQETYKYKELDDELDEELRNEMCALALAGKTDVEDPDSKVNFQPFFIPHLSSDHHQTKKSNTSVGYLHLLPRFFLKRKYN